METTKRVLVFLCLVFGTVAASAQSCYTIELLNTVGVESIQKCNNTFMVNIQPVDELTDLPTADDISVVVAVDNDTNALESLETSITEGAQQGQFVVYVNDEFPASYNMVAQIYYVVVACGQQDAVKQQFTIVQTATVTTEARSLENNADLSSKIITAPSFPETFDVDAGVSIVATPQNSEYRFVYWSAATETLTFNPQLPQQVVTSKCWPVRAETMLTAWYEPISTSVFENPELGVAVNETNGTLQVRTPRGCVALQVYNALGENLLSVECGEQTMQHVPHQLSSGSYFLVVSTTTTTVVVPFLIQ